MIDLNRLLGAALTAAIPLVGLGMFIGIVVFAFSKFEKRPLVAIAILVFFVFFFITFLVYFGVLE